MSCDLKSNRIILFIQTKAKEPSKYNKLLPESRRIYVTGRSSFNELESSSYRMHSSEFSSKGKLAKVFPLQGEERRRERVWWMRTFSGEKAEKAK